MDRIKPNLAWNCPRSSSNTPLNLNSNGPAVLSQSSIRFDQFPQSQPGFEPMTIEPRAGLIPPSQILLYLRNSFRIYVSSSILDNTMKRRNKGTAATGVRTLISRTKPLNVSSELTWLFDNRILIYPYILTDRY